MDLNEDYYFDLLMYLPRGNVGALRIDIKDDESCPVKNIEIFVADVKVFSVLYIPLFGTTGQWWIYHGEWVNDIDKLVQHGKEMVKANKEKRKEEEMKNLLKYTPLTESDMPCF